MFRTEFRVVTANGIYRIQARKERGIKGLMTWWGPWRFVDKYGEHSKDRDPYEVDSPLAAKAKCEFFIEGEVRDQEFRRRVEEEKKAARLKRRELRKVERSMAWVETSCDPLIDALSEASTRRSAARLS